MTLTLSTLSEWRRQEKDTPGLCHPPPLADIKTLMDQLLQEAGEDPLALGEDCEIFAAKDLLADIFEIRRAKLARAAELNPDDATLPNVKNWYPFESNAWFHLTNGYRLLDKCTKEIVSNGAWNGKWGP